MRRGQTATEYLFMVGGIIFFAVFLFIAIKGELVPRLAGGTRADTASMLDEYGRPYQFYDNFEGGVIKRWKQAGGNWRADNRELLQEEIAGNNFALVGDVGWDEYEVRADVYNDGTFGGIVVRYQDDGLHYRCGIESAHTYIDRCDASGCMRLNTTIAAISGWTPLTARAQGSRLSCTLGEPGSPSAAVLTADDASDPYLYGKPGLYTTTGPVRFDNFRVAKLPARTSFATPTPTPPPPLEIYDLYLTCDLPDPKKPLIGRYTFHWTTNLPADSNASFYWENAPLQVYWAYNPSLTETHAVRINSFNCKSIPGGVNLIANVSSCTAPGPYFDCASLVAVNP
ncbi:MAG: hypothetical protein V1787_03690 [Candidatus Micrarchaeota archaeon]